MPMEKVEFRFETMDIWIKAIQISKSLFIHCDTFRKHKQFTLSDQLFRATLSITNNIAEGSGSTSKKDFSNFINISRRSVYECVNIMHIALHLKLLNEEDTLGLKVKLLELSKMLFYFRQSLLNC